MNYREQLANKANYGNKRIEPVEFLVIHYSGNDGDTDQGNANYFQNNIVKASANYFTDDDSVTLSVPENYVAYAVGGTKRPGATLYDVCRNSNSISIELCDTVKNGVYGFTEATLNNAAELIRVLMSKYNIPISRVVRHYDVTGKICPRPFVDNVAAWNEFKNRIVNYGKPQATQPVQNNTGVNAVQLEINKAVQKWLNDYCGAKLVVDGVFNDSCKKTLNKALQKAIGATQDGIIGAVTKSKLPTISMGSTGNIVKVFEAYLYVRGFNPSEFGGTFTLDVNKAAKEFQTKNGLTPDAVIGKLSWDKIVF